MKKSHNDDRAKQIKELEDKIYELNQSPLDYIHTREPSKGGLIINSGRAKEDENSQVRLANWPLRRDSQTGTHYRDYPDFYSRLERLEALREKLLKMSECEPSEMEKIQWAGSLTDLAEVFGKLFDAGFLLVDQRISGEDERTLSKFFNLIARHFIQKNGRPILGKSLVDSYARRKSPKSPGVSPARFVVYKKNL